MQNSLDLLAYGLSDYLINALIYALFAIPLFVLFWVVGRQRLQHRRIQPKQRSTPATIRREVRNSAITLMLFAGIDVLLYVAQQHGYTQLYDAVSDHGWGYLTGSVFGMILLHDAWFYWTHRLMHHPWLFRFVHKVHHESVDPSPFAAFSFHPLEALVEAGIYVVFAFLFPVHLIALYSWQIFQMLMNVIGHLGYEIYPSGLATHWLFRWKTPSTHHNMHHAKFNGNYGLYFTWWDKWLKTEFSDYAHTYERVHRQIAQKSSATLGIMLLAYTVGLAQQELPGKWLSADKEGITEIYARDGQFFGKLVWLKKPTDSTGQPFTDTQNPVVTLRKQPLLGLQILSGFRYERREWKGGTIYDPETGKTYSCVMRLTDPNTLTVRGYWGPFYQTQTWTRVP